MLTTYQTTAHRVRDIVDRVAAQVRPVKVEGLNRALRPAGERRQGHHRQDDQMHQEGVVNTCYGGFWLVLPRPFPCGPPHSAVAG